MLQTKMSPCLFLFLLLILSSSTLVSGFVFRYSNLSESKNAIRVLLPNIYLSPGLKSAIPPNMGTNFSYYRNISKLSADERCKTGQPLGAAFLEYSPYASSSPFFDPKTFKSGFVFYGIMPGVLKQALDVCCHRNSGIQFVRLLNEQKLADGTTNSSEDYDFIFPLYGEDMDTSMYRGNPFISIIQAPSVVLLVKSDDSKVGKTKLIATTIWNTWPMMIFILLIASISGMIMWFLDHSFNQEEFPRPFVNGAWESFWWAFITMTTVGYGDRTPKSYLGRFFAVLWIIFSIIIVSVFTGLVTAALDASTRTSFTIQGTKIGAVRGSKEFELGISLNADMIAFKSLLMAIGALDIKDVRGVLVDNYVLARQSVQVVRMKLRVERSFNSPITYGVMFGRNSTYVEGCVRKYIRDNPQEVFDTIRQSLVPLKNPKDKENLRLKEAERLFYRDETWSNVISYGGFFVLGLLFFGVFSQLFLYCWRRKGRSPEMFTHRVVRESEMKYRFGSFERVDDSLNDLIEQYKCFQDGWMTRLKAIQDE